MKNIHILLLIIFENDVFYLKNYKIFDCIKEIKKINLFEYSSEFKELFDLNDILSIYNDELNKENDNGEEYYIKYIEIFRYKIEYEKKIFFNMFYDFESNGNIIFDIHYSWKSNQSTILLNNIILS